MKKIILLLLCCISLGLCGCEKTAETKNEEKQTEAMSTTQGGAVQEADELTMLCNAQNSYAGCSTSSGYYYLTEDVIKLKENEWGMHMMYMDYATKQEIYLCSDTGCKHDTADCTAVFLSSDFPLFSTRIFAYKEYLYVLSKEYDNDGSVVTDYSIGESDVEIESNPVVLYRMNLDGTNRQAIYTFEHDLVLEDFVLADDQGFYMITKKLSTESVDYNTYTTSTERNIVYLDLEARTIEIVCSLDFGDSIDWDVIGCYGQKLVLSGTDFEREVSLEEWMDDDIWRELYENSEHVVAVLDLETKEVEEISRISNKTEYAEVILDGRLYRSYAESGEIESIDLETREETLLCTLEQNYICSTFEDTLCCRSWDLADDQTFYFVDVKTGQVQHSGLVNKSLGWALEMVADLGEQVLVIYDYEATSHGDGSYEINRYQYGLISKEDLFAGVDHFLPVQMIGKGR